jgi:hypothetical protein
MLCSLIAESEIEELHEDLRIRGWNWYHRCGSRCMAFVVRANQQLVGGLSILHAFLELLMRK